MKPIVERMIFINIIIVFLLGIIFTQWITPLVEGGISIFLTWLKTIETALAVKITQYQKQIEQIKEEKQEEHPAQIGFVVVPEEEDEEIDDN